MTTGGSGVGNVWSTRGRRMASRSRRPRRVCLTDNRVLANALLTESFIARPVPRTVAIDPRTADLMAVSDALTVLAVRWRVVLMARLTCRNDSVMARPVARSEDLMATANARTGRSDATTARRRPRAASTTGMTNTAATRNAPFWTMPTANLDAGTR